MKMKSKLLLGFLVIVLLSVVVYASVRTMTVGYTYLGGDDHEYLVTNTAPDGGSYAMDEFTLPAGSSNGVYYAEGPSLWQVTDLGTATRFDCFGACLIQPNGGDGVFALASTGTGTCTKFASAYTVIGERFDYVFATVPDYDGDGDGVGNSCDSCINVSNPDQTDADGDTFGEACDCDDTNENIYPGATEVCNGVDDDCDSLIDEGVCATLIGKVLLGVRNVSQPVHSNILNVTLKNLDTSEIISDIILSNETGYFLITSLIPGPYDIWVKPDQHLAVRVNSTPITGFTAIDLGKAGHGDLSMNNNSGSFNKVDFMDIGPISSSYNAETGNPNYNPNADANYDGKVDFKDLGPFSANYLREGAPIIE